MLIVTDKPIILSVIMLLLLKTYLVYQNKPSSLIIR